VDTGSTEEEHLALSGMTEDGFLEGKRTWLTDKCEKPSRQGMSKSLEICKNQAGWGSNKQFWFNGTDYKEMNVGMKIDKKGERSCRGQK
jgi:hypothetical protein